MSSIDSKLHQFLCCTLYISQSLEGYRRWSLKVREGWEEGEECIFFLFGPLWKMFWDVSQNTNLDKMGNVRLVKFQWKGVGHLSEWSIPYGFDVARKEEKCDFLFLKQTITTHSHTLTTEETLLETKLVIGNNFELYSLRIVAILCINLCFLFFHFHFLEARRSPVIESATLPLLSCSPAGKDLAKAGKIIAKRRAFHWLLLRCLMQYERDQCSKY